MTTALFLEGARERTPGWLLRLLPDPTCCPWNGLTDRQLTLEEAVELATVAWNSRSSPLRQRIAMRCLLPLPIGDLAMWHPYLLPYAWQVLRDTAEVLEHGGDDRLTALRNSLEELREVKSDRRFYPRNYDTWALVHVLGDRLIGPAHVGSNRVLMYAYDHDNEPWYQFRVGQAHIKNCITQAAAEEEAAGRGPARYAPLYPEWLTVQPAWKQKELAADAVATDTAE